MHEFLQADPVRFEVHRVLTALENGLWSPAYESVYLDFKEEAGRRDRDGVVLPSSARNEPAAYALAGEAACMANTAHGGALIVGVADDGEIIGTDLDIPWLRQRIYDLTQQMLTVDAYAIHLKGHRLLVLIAPESLTPIPWQGVIHWRVKDQCQPIEREAWAARASYESALDWTAQDSKIPAYYARTQALDLAREILRATGLQNCINMASAADEELLSRLQVLTSQGTLTNAGFLLFIGRTKPSINYTHATRTTLRTAPHPPASSARISLLEQLVEVQDAIERASNFEVENEHWIGIPPQGLHHALLYHLLVRNWAVVEPSTIKHTPKRALIVAPLVGSLEQEKTANPQAENRALIAVLRELHLVEDAPTHANRLRYYMLKSGMSLPTIKEVAGPYLRVSMRAVPYDPAWSYVLRRLTPRATRRELETLQLLNFIRDVQPVTVAEIQAELALDTADLSRLLARCAQLSYEGIPVLKASVLQGQESWSLTPEFLQATEKSWADQAE